MVLGLMLSGTLCAQEGYNIEVEIEGLAGEEAYLGYHLGEGKYIEDTAQLLNGKAVFKGADPLNHGIYFLYTPEYFLEFVITDEQHFKLASDTKEPLLNKNIMGSPENELFKTFQVNMAKTQGGSADLRERLSEAKTREDTTKIYDQIDALSEANRVFQDSLAASNPESYVAKLLTLIRKPETVEAPDSLNNSEAKQYRFNAYKDEFFKGVDFNYAGYLRTPLFHDRIMEYIEDLTSPEPDSVIKELDFLLSKADQNEDVFRYILVNFTNRYAQPKLMGDDGVFVHLAENYYLTGKANWADEEMLKGFKKAVEELKPNLIGQPAPPLELLDTTNNQVSLNDIQAKYTVLFFYDPECGHCKKQTPIVLEFYHKFQSVGVELLGVCVPTDRKKWIDYINERSLDWVNLADPYVESNFRKEYNIKSFPTIYVLDEDKNIIAKRIGAEQLDDFINARIRAGY